MLIYDFIDVFATSAGKPVFVLTIKFVIFEQNKLLMKNIIPYLILCSVIALAACSTIAPREQFNVLDYGACGDGVTDCTEAFNNAILDCSRANGRILVPEGRYLCSTIVLKDNVELCLQSGSEIVGDMNPENYSSFIPAHDLSKYDSGDGTVNQNNSRDERWNKALILANGVSNVRICGEGVINGRHVFDPLGEEYMRGPHGIIMGECRNVTIEDITITCASNYAFMSYALEDAVFRNIHITEGWDGIHIRGGSNILIDACKLETGDDSIAGGYWENVEIRNCSINSSCNGIRMIMPCDGLEVHDCNFFGPGNYPHRTSGEKHRTNMLFGLNLQPGGWGKAPGDVRNVYIHDCTMSGLSSPIGINNSDESHACDLTLENISATGLYGTVSPVVCYNDSGYDSIKIVNFTVSK